MYAKYRFPRTTRSPIHYTKSSPSTSWARRLNYIAIFGTRDVIPHNRTFVSDREIQAVRGVLESGWLVRGSVTEQTEKYLRDRSGAAECVLVSSGTAALRLALIALGRGNRDEVIVPSYCC